MQAGQKQTARAGFCESSRLHCSENGALVVGSEAVPFLPLFRQVREGSRQRGLVHQQLEHRGFGVSRELVAWERLEGQLGQTGNRPCEEEAASVYVL